MFPLLEMEKLDEPEFKWAKKRGIGGKKKDVQFYESFTYDGVDYTLYDCVYMHKEGEPEPYIGKLVKIWENADKSKKIKVQWFFRPSEIAYYLGDVEVLENELFFASGKGNGLANLNPLEAIAGKCNVVCISNDTRNSQPSTEELQIADYVFYRIFDVKSCAISDQMGETVGGLEVKYVFNRGESVTILDVPKFDLSIKGEERSANAGKETVKLAAMQRSGCTDNAVGPEKDARLMKDSDVLAGSLSKTNTFSCRENSECAKDSMDTEKDKNLGENLSAGREMPPTSNVVSPSETMRLSTTNVLPNETAKTGSNMDFDGSGQAAKLARSSSAKMKGQLKTSLDLSMEKLKHGHDTCHVSKGKRFVEDSCSMEGVPQKKAKFDDSIKIAEFNEGNISKKSMEKTRVSETKNLSLLRTPYDDKGKSKLSKGALKESHNEKVAKLSNDNLSITSLKGGDDEKVGGQIFEVTRRPNVEKSNWIKLSWEERMKTAHDQGRLVLLHNLDPEYASGEVEDIIWHAFNELCTAKVVQHTAISNPHSGQAFVIFKTREAVDKVVKKLDDRCLMLPNHRLRGCHHRPLRAMGPTKTLTKVSTKPRTLVVSTGFFPKEKQMKFVGHLAIDRARRQIQREMKEAVSTSHYSQNNTIEYEMAMQWCLLYSKSDRWWKKLYEQQRKELRELTDDLKSK